MFRMTQYLKELVTPTPVGPHRNPPGPVVIWNLVRRCNLSCKHCYSSSSDRDFSGELSTAEIKATLDSLKKARVPALILSGGEPLLRPDLFEIAAHAQGLGFYMGLSSNGTLIDQETAKRVRAAGFDYVGVSLDGIGAVNDRFRGKEGAFVAALNGLRLARDAGCKVGLRFTVTRDNEADLPDMLELMEAEGIEKLYLSHLNYAGRGNANRADDSALVSTRKMMEMLFETGLAHIKAGREREFVTGNNDADGPLLLLWVKKHFPEKAEHIAGKLRQWGGNASGVNVANIDNRGNVHPDTMWWHHSLGNVRERAFGEIWHDLSDPALAGLKQRPRKLKGRCGACQFLDICNGNSRVRAFRAFDDLWAEDPGCFLTDAEIGLTQPAEAAQ